MNTMTISRLLDRLEVARELVVLVIDAGNRGEIYQRY